MTDYKLGEKNQFDIEYGLTVLREDDGSVVRAEAQAANQEIQTVYPQRNQPGNLEPEFGQRSAPTEIHHCPAGSLSVGLFGL
jgi:hypothetical protein